MEIETPVTHFRNTDTITRLTERKKDGEKEREKNIPNICNFNIYTHIDTLKILPF